jgi:hypothetical protein
MDTTIDVLIPIDIDAAQALESPGRRKAVGRYLSGLLSGGTAAHVLAEAIAEAKLEGRANGLTDAAVEAELDDWVRDRATRPGL